MTLTGGNGGSRQPWQVGSQLVQLHSNFYCILSVLQSKPAFPVSPIVDGWGAGSSSPPPPLPSFTRISPGGLGGDANRTDTFRSIRCAVLRVQDLYPRSPLEEEKAFSFSLFSFSQ